MDPNTQGPMVAPTDPRTKFIVVLNDGTTYSAMTGCVAIFPEYDSVYELRLGRRIGRASVLMPKAWDSITTPSEESCCSSEAGGEPIG